MAAKETKAFSFLRQLRWADFKEKLFNARSAPFAELRQPFITLVLVLWYKA